MAVVLGIATKDSNLEKAFPTKNLYGNILGMAYFFSFWGNIVYCVHIGRFDDVYIVVGHVWTAKKDRKIHGISLGGHPSGQEGIH